VCYTHVDGSEVMGFLEEPLGFFKKKTLCLPLGSQQMTCRQIEAYTYIFQIFLKAL